MTQPPLTLGAVARHFDQPVWRIRRLFERNLIPAAARCGLYRVVAPDELPAIEAALVQAGYLRKEAPLVAS